MTESMQDSLLRLGQALADAALSGAQAQLAEPVSVAEVTTLVDADALAEHVRPGVVVADAACPDGSVGRSLLVVCPADARTLAGPPDDRADADAADARAAAETETGDAATPARVLDAIAAVADAMNEAAANALTMLLGQPARYEPARALVVEDPRFVVRPGPVQAVCVELTTGEVTCHLIHFAPNALVMRAARAFEDLAHDALPPGAPRGPGGPSARTLSAMNLRVWAELGRTELGLSEALALPLGAVVELDRDSDAPVDLMVNGMRLGSGRLEVTDEGEWAITLDEVGPAPV